MKLFSLLALLLFIGYPLCKLNAQVVTDFADLHLPDDLEVDRFGNVWVNYNTGTVPDTFHLARITPDGTITNVITEPFELGQFGINDSIIWISSWTADKVYKYNHQGQMLDSVSINAPTAIILDPDNTWYVAQNQNSRILHFETDNTYSVIASGTPLSNNLALARDENGNVYTCNLYNAKVIKVDAHTGNKTVLATLPTSMPYSVGFLAYYRGYLYVPGLNNCIYRVDTAGISYTIYTGIEDSAGYLNDRIATSLFNGPTSVAFSPTGDTMYIADAGNNKIRKVTPDSSTTGLHGLIANAFVKLYPNPIENSLNISLTAPNKTVVNITIINAQGCLLGQFTIPPDTSTITYDTAALLPGLYAVLGTSADGRPFKASFIKP